MTTYGLNPNLFLNLRVDVVLQSKITLIAGFSSIKIILHCFLVQLLVNIYVFYDLYDILLQFLANVYDLILLLYVSHFVTIFRHYLFLFLCHFFHTFHTCFHQSYLYSVFHRIFVSSFI